MTAKRFEIVLSGGDVSQYEIIDHEQEQLTIYNDLGNVYFSSALQLCDLLNELHEENKQIKDLIHTMLKQIDVENITSDSAIYSARIIFSGNEFNLIRELWKRG